MPASRCKPGVPGAGVGCRLRRADVGAHGEERVRVPGPEMSLGRYLIGVAALLCVLGSLGVGAAAVRRYLLPDWSGAYARLAESVTGCALLVGIMQVLGTVGLFRLVPMVVGSVAVGSALRL